MTTEKVTNINKKVKATKVVDDDATKPAKTSTEKITVTVTAMRTDAKDTFWVQRIWDAKKPLWLVLANYPAADDPRQLDLTSMLIQNSAVAGGAGGVVITNLFTKRVKHASEKSLTWAYDVGALDEIAKQAMEVEKVVIAIGSLNKRFKIAQERLDQFYTLAQELSFEDKLSVLVSPSTGKPVHPLAIQNDHWEFEPVHLG